MSWVDCFVAAKIDPYVVFTVKTQEKKSNVAKGNSVLVMNYMC